MEKCKQHHKPCATCPFTDKVEPGYLGGSPPEVYVAQHFMPYRVPCHEFVNYDLEDWKSHALTDAVPQCVGFAECRNGDEVDQIMPNVLLKEERKEEHHTFQDIWDFWAFHKEISRATALCELTPNKITSCVITELTRDGMRFLGGSMTREEMIMLSLSAARRAWEDAVTTFISQRKQKL